MQRTVFRHGKKDLSQRHVEGDPPITFAAVLQAQQIGWHFKREHGFYLPTDFAVSELVRTEQTARALGALNVQKYSQLNEVHTDIPDDELYEMLKRGELPEELWEAGEELYLNPPAECAWVGHELTTVGLTAVTALRDGKSLTEVRLVPEYLEARILDIPTVSASSHHSLEARSFV